MASGSEDKTINIWNTNDSSLVNNITAHSSYISSLAVLENGDLASGSHDTKIKIWNTENYELIRTIETGNSNSVDSLTVLRGAKLASGSYAGLIQIWNVNDGTLARKLEGHTNRVFGLTVLSNGWLVSGSADYTVKVWDVRDDEGWEKTCEMYSCRSKLMECANQRCLGKEECTRCVQSYDSLCLRCVYGIFDEAGHVTLANNETTIVCDAGNQLHVTVCSFYCKSLNRVNNQCKTENGRKVCKCLDPSK